MSTTSGGEKTGVSAAPVRPLARPLKRSASAGHPIDLAVLDGDEIALDRVALGHESLDAAGKGEVELRAVLRRRERREAGELKPETGDIAGDPHGVVDRIAPVAGRDQRAVGKRAAPVGAALETLEPMHDPDQAADIAGIAIRVPPCGVHDRHRLVEIAARIDQGEQDQGVVGHDVAIARIFVVAVVVLDLLPRVAPVGQFGAPCPHVPDERGDQRVRRDHRQADLEQMIDVGRTETPRPPSPRAVWRHAPIRRRD